MPMVLSAGPPSASGLSFMSGDNASGHLTNVITNRAEGTGSIPSILRAVRNHLGMDVAFVSQFEDGRRFFEHVDGTAPFKPGDSSPLEEGYCQRVVDGRLPELIPDTSQNAAAMALTATRKVPVGAHVSVPIRLRDGRVYGTFCCFSYQPDRTLGERDLEVMRAFADISAIEIQRDLDAFQVSEAKRVRIRAQLDGSGPGLAFQPIYTASDSTVVGWECLARFSGSPRRSPDQWFAEANEVGLGTVLETAVLRQALACLPRLHSGVYLAVNVSPPVLQSGEMARALEGAPAERIVLEVTEHAAVSDYDHFAAALAPLRRSGIRLAVDDAGAGFASFRHVLNLRPEIVKMDMSLTRNIDHDPARRALAGALTSLAREIKSQTIAEGVETASELEALRSLGVDMVQGYFLGRPMPLEDVAQHASDGRNTPVRGTPVPAETGEEIPTAC